MKGLKITFAILFLIFLNQKAQAQVNQLTLEKCYELAQQNYP